MASSFQSPFPLPGVKHGQRILTSVIEARAKANNTPAWVSVPINDQDLSQGFRDISFKELNNAANHAAHWLKQNLPPTSEPFQCFAYAGPKDLRYQILAVAAAKVQKVMVLPSPLVTAEAQLHILEKKGCTVYLRPSSMEAPVAEILKAAPHVQTVTVPDIEAFMQEAEAEPINYSKTYEEGRADPWLVFHTSGTTGNPKPVTYTHEMMAGADIVASLPDIGETQIHHYAQRRCYTPLPSLHFVGMALSLSMTTFIHMTAVIGPPTPPTPSTIISLLQHGNITTAMFPPVPNRRPNPHPRRPLRPPFPPLHPLRRRPLIPQNRLPPTPPRPHNPRSRQHRIRRVLHRIAPIPERRMGLPHLQQAAHRGSIRTSRPRLNH
ncbi:hypothetical protein ABZX51_003961 [Aspergillus tubingensis]